MLVFGVDIPLPELILAFSIITAVLLLEAIVLIALVAHQQSKNKKQQELFERMVQALEHKKK